MTCNRKRRPSKPKVNSTISAPATIARWSNSRWSLQWALMCTPRAMLEAPPLPAPVVGQVEKCGDWRPENCPGDGVHPSQRIGDRVVGPTVNEEEYDFIGQQHREHDQGLLKRGLGTDLLMLVHGHKSDGGECEGVLAQHWALKHVEQEAGNDAECDAARARGGRRPGRDGQGRERR